MSADTTAPKQQIGIPFKPGQSGNPAGRPQGSRNKLGEDFLKAMCDDFDQYGVAAIERVRIEKPEQYLKVVASILPKETAVEITHRFVARMPAPAESVEEWLTQHSQKSNSLIQ